MRTATAVSELSPFEYAHAEQALVAIIAAAQRRGQEPLKAERIEAVFLSDVIRRAADDVDWARHLLSLATAHRWPDFGDVLRRNGIERQ